MSLIHWWPLNGDTKDYGCGNVELVFTASYDYTNAGKIGKALQLSSSYFSSSFQAPNKMSIAFWIYPNDTGSWSDIFSIGTNLGRIEKTSTDVYYWYQSSKGGSNLCSNGEIFTLENQQWQHITVTIDGTSVKFYVNGELKNTISQTSPLTSAMDDNRIVWSHRGSQWEGQYKGCFNDIRIYDHALSVKEIKEISKGLMLHYNFEDHMATAYGNVYQGTNNAKGDLTTSGNG